MFTPEELEAIADALKTLVNTGFAENDEDPIVTALAKVKAMLSEEKTMPIVDSEGTTLFGVLAPGLKTKDYTPENRELLNQAIKKVSENPFAFVPLKPVIRPEDCTPDNEPFLIEKIKKAIFNEVAEEEYPDIKSME